MQALSQLSYGPVPIGTGLVADPITQCKD